MRTSSKLIIIFGILVGSFCGYQFVRNMKRPAKPNVEQLNDTTEIQSRPGITFILGEDKDEFNPYYEQARRYYTYHEEGKTDYVVSFCKSLLEVRNYLEKTMPENGVPWGRINLVSHGNQWTGLSVRVTTDSKRTTTERVREHINNSSFRPLPDSVVDGDTEIFIHGCGIGNNEELVDAIGEAFGGRENTPVVRASRLFEYYTSLQLDEQVMTERYLTKTWLISYKMKEPPPPLAIVNELRDKYSEAGVDWNGALQRRMPRWPGDIYHYTFEVPVKWIISNGDPLPGVADESAQLAWIQRQSNIIAELVRLNLPKEKFSWSFTKVYVKNSDGEKSPAVLVKGYCTILTVLQPLAHPQSGDSLPRPVTVPYNNNEYYYSTHNIKIKTEAGSWTCEI
jgi:hypothetical protein